MRVVLYMRMSTDKQENSIDSQDQMLVRYAKTHKMQIVDKYIDEGISGRTAEKRPSFMRMIEDSTKDIFDAVLVYDSSRFARNLEESIVYKSLLKKNNVTLISATEPTLDEDSSLITDAMLGALNEMYSRKLSKAVRRGMIYSAQKGYCQTPPPYGYDKEKRVMFIIPHEAEVVRKIFEMFIECPSWHSVAVKLNDMGIPKRKAYAWYGRDIKRMLQNSVYIGNVNYCGEVYKGLHEPIIDKKTWDSVQEIIANKPEGKKRPPSTYKHWLSGMLRCGHCGGRMNYTTDNRGNTSYRCSRHANGGCANSNFMSVKKFEILMHFTLESLIQNDNLMGYDFLVQKKNRGDELTFLKTSLKKVQSKLDRHKEAYSNGIDSLMEYKENKEKCMKEELELKKQIALIDDEKITADKIINLKSSVEVLKEYLYSDEYSIDQKSFAIKSVIDKITFNKNTGEFSVYYFV